MWMPQKAFLAHVGALLHVTLVPKQFPTTLLPVFPGPWEISTPADPAPAPSTPFPEKMLRSSFPVPPMMLSEHWPFQSDPCLIFMSRRSPSGESPMMLL